MLPVTSELQKKHYLFYLVKDCWDAGYFLVGQKAAQASKAGVSTPFRHGHQLDISSGHKRIYWVLPMTSVRPPASIHLL